MRAKIEISVLIMALASLVAGVALIMFDCRETGSYLIAAAIGATLLKQVMDKKASPIFLVALILPIVGCDPHMINAEAIESPLRRVIMRHDKYVNGDQGLTPRQKTIYLRSSKLLLEVIDGALLND